MFVCTYVRETGDGEAEGEADVQYARGGAPVDAGGAADDDQQAGAQRLREQRHEEAHAAHLVQAQTVLSACWQSKRG